jgi:SAM-dependent methyltransferase
MSATDRDAVALDPDILEHYAGGRERDRLARDGQPGLEFVRTLELLERFLPPAPADVLDVGGGAGAYAHTLAARGYRVKLVDPVPLHVEQARETATRTGHRFEAVLGDARALAEAERSQDVVLLMGPLYHLTERAERVRALREAGRVLRHRGFVFAVGISRYRSLLGGLAAGELGEAEFAQIVATDLATGQQRNPSKRPDRFTTAYFHEPEELIEEVREAGLAAESMLGIEGPGWMFPERWTDASEREGILQAARLFESRPGLLALSTHIAVIGRALFEKQANSISG